MFVAEHDLSKKGLKRIRAYRFKCQRHRGEHELRKKGLKQGGQEDVLPELAG